MRVLFFTYTEWAFGSIHSQLSKYLDKYGIAGNILDWSVSHSMEEVKELIDITDFVITTPCGWNTLKLYYNNPLPHEKCILFIHARFDIEKLLYYNIHIEDLEKFHSYCAVSKWLQDLSISYNLKRIPKLVRLGINYKMFYNKNISKELKVVGYAGTYKDRHEPLAYGEGGIPATDHVKRGFLVKDAANLAGLTFKIAKEYNTTFVTMPGFYKTVDAVVCSSTEEGAGLPALEGAAAGKLILTTPVGHWEEKITPIGADTLPFEDNELVLSCTASFEYYKNNPSKYRQRCLEIQEFAKTYDWDYVIQDWLELIK